MTTLNVDLLLRVDKIEKVDPSPDGKQVALVHGYERAACLFGDAARRHARRV